MYVTMLTIISSGSAYAWGMATNLQLTNGDEDSDAWGPIPITGNVVQCSGTLKTVVVH